MGVKIHRSLRPRLLHPVHGSCPVQSQDLEARRATVMPYSGPRGWERVLQEDVWQNGQVPPAAPVSGTWREWTFCRLAESPQDGQGSLGVRRIYPDSIAWSPDESASPYNMPQQIGRSSGAQRRGQPLATERGAAAMSSTPTSGPGRGGA